LTTKVFCPCIHVYVPVSAYMRERERESRTAQTHRSW